jgi:hypothetical protein
VASTNNINIYNMTEEEHDAYIESLPLCDEHGYPLLTDENGDEVLDDWGEPIRTGFGCGSMQVEPLDTTLSHVEFVVKTNSW